MYSLFNLLQLLLSLYTFIIIGSAIFSWLYAFQIVNPSSSLVRMIGQFFYRATEPVLKHIRNILPDLGAIDISPVVLLFVIYLIRTRLLPFLFFGIF